MELTKVPRRPHSGMAPYVSLRRESLACFGPSLPECRRSTGHGDLVRARRRSLFSAASTTAATADTTARRKSQHQQEQNHAPSERREFAIRRATTESDPADRESRQKQPRSVENRPSARTQRTGCRGGG